MNKRILIIKTGHSETFCREVDAFPSLGDVLRTTVLLSAFSKDDVSWLVSPEAASLLPLKSSNIFLWNEQGRELLKNLDFDFILNLEKGPEFLDFLKSLSASQKIGFVFNSTELQTFSSPIPLSSVPRHPWQRGLFTLIERDWAEEGYAIKSPSYSENYDVGFNWLVGSKWSNKVWPKEFWLELEQKLKAQGLTVSWQEGVDHLDHYTHWVASNRFIVTLDSLGLHIALALKKNVLALFGPTSTQEIHLYHLGVALQSSALECNPCQTRTCQTNKQCMKELSPQNVYENLLKMIERNS